MATASRRSASTVITEARAPRSEDLARRQRNYLILMAFRVICIVSMFFVPGIWRWLLLAGAAILPGIAVLIANNIDVRTTRVPANDSANRQITASTDDQVVPGELVTDEVDDAGDAEDQSNRPDDR